MKIPWRNNHGNAGNQPRGCWLRSANTTSVLCHPHYFITVWFGVFKTLKVVVVFIRDSVRLKYLIFFFSSFQIISRKTNLVPLSSFSSNRLKRIIDNSKSENCTVVKETFNVWPRDERALKWWPGTSWQTFDPLTGSPQVARGRKFLADMLRKNLMKRLTKSASDISGCTKKTHSTSPDEEEKETKFGTPPEDGASDDEDYYEDEQRWDRELFVSNELF